MKKVKTTLQLEESVYPENKCLTEKQAFPQSYNKTQNHNKELIPECFLYNGGIQNTQVLRDLQKYIALHQ